MQRLNTVLRRVNLGTGPVTHEEEGKSPGCARCGRRSPYKVCGSCQRKLHGIVQNAATMFKNHLMDAVQGSELMFRRMALKNAKTSLKELRTCASFGVEWNELESAERDFRHASDLIDIDRDIKKLTSRASSSAPKNAAKLTKLNRKREKLFLKLGTSTVVHKQSEMQPLSAAHELKLTEAAGLDPLLMQVADSVVETGVASMSMIQHQFSINYSRASKIMEQMESIGLVSRYDGSKPRSVLLTPDEWSTQRGLIETDETPNGSTERAAMMKASRVTIAAGKLPETDDLERETLQLCDQAIVELTASNASTSSDERQSESLQQP